MNSKVIEFDYKSEFCIGSRESEGQKSKISMPMLEESMT
jgi:hypothetical protein